MLMKKILLISVYIGLLGIAGCGSQTDDLKECPYKTTAIKTTEENAINDTPPTDDYEPSCNDEPPLNGEDKTETPSDDSDNDELHHENRLSAHRETGIVEIYIFGIGRADAILITTENHAMMIDTGENRHGDYIVNTLLYRNITALDYLIITHFDSDHVGGAHTIIDNIAVGKVIIPNYSRASGHVERFKEAMERAGLEPYVLTETIWRTLDDAEFMINPAELEYFSFIGEIDEDAPYDPAEMVFIPTGDDFSIVVSVAHGGNNFLFTGDAVANRLGELLDNDEIIGTDFDFLKVPRHGRHNRRSVAFIHAISPRYAVITGFCPSMLVYYYPERPTDERVIAALEDTGAAIYFTMSRGVHVRSDGVNINLQLPE